MRKLYKYLKPHLIYAIIAPISMIVEVSSELLLPQIMSGIVDVGIAQRDYSYIALRGLLMVIIAFIGVLGGVGCTVFATKASQNFGTDVRAAMFKRIQSFSFVNLDKFHTSSLITRLTNDITQIQLVVLTCLRMLIRAPFTFMGGLILAFMLSPKLTVSLFIAVIVLVAFVSVIMSKGFALFGAVQDRIDRVNTVMRENLAGVRVVKAFDRSAIEKEKFNNVNNDLMNTTISAFRIVTLTMPIMMIIMHITTAVVLWRGGNMVIKSEMSTGDLMAYITYLTQILMSLMMVGMAFIIISRGKASIGRINEVLDTEFDIVDSENPVKDCIKEGTIEFKNVGFSYPESKGEPILENISFKAHKGQTIGIIGETGCGKSTLVNLIPRLYDVTEGEILIDGVNVKNIKLDYLRKEIGMVLQKAILFSGTISDNIRWGKDNASDEEVYEAAKKAQAYDFIENLPDKFDTVLGQMGVNLSGGQKQRISIARTIIQKPKIMIFDDSTSALDTKTEKNIQQVLKNEYPDSLKIIIAQKISSIMHADNIMVIHGKGIYASGTHEQLLENCDIYKDICDSQMKKEEV